jgi:uncharacterized protein YjlB/alkylated DNA repair dioxygenase AlkB
LPGRQLSLFADAPIRPNGFQLQPGFIVGDEERELITRISELPLTPFQFGAFEGKRLVVSFGWRYNYALQRLERAGELPGWLLPLASRVEDFGELPRGAIQQVLCTEYEAGVGIGWHRDKPHFDQVFGLSLASTCKFRFRRKVGNEWQRETFDVEPRSIYLLSGEARSAWEHSIPPVNERRFSITFRTMADPAGKTAGVERRKLMSLLEDGKKVVESVTGWRRPSKDDLDHLVRDRKANTFQFKDDGVVPNHPHWPLIVYRRVVNLPTDLDPAAIFEDVFERNGWENSWRNGIYDYVHYHSRIHEVLGIARGSAKVRFGGNGGRALDVKAGDVAILPAGTGHQRLDASDDLLVVGAYPRTGTYDECTSSEDHNQAVKTIAKVMKPRKDPVFGANGPLISIWKLG